MVNQSCLWEAADQMGGFPASDSAQKWAAQIGSKA